MPEKSLKQLGKQYHLNPEQLEELLQLLRGEQSPAYLLRYRKDLAASLTCEDLSELLAESQRLQEVEKERRKIRNKLLEQGVLTDELEQKLNAAETVTELIDHYVPYRPRKRSRSRLAIDQGLEPLARAVFEQEEPIPLMAEAAKEYVDPSRGVPEAADVLEGTFHIICDWIAEEKTHRDKQREVIEQEGKVRARGVQKSLPSRLRNEFREYLSFEAPLKQVHPHQALCLQRGKRLKALSFSVDAPLKYMYRMAADLYLGGGAEQFNQIDVRFGETEKIPEREELGELSGAEFLYFCVKYSLAGILAPVLVRERERRLRSDAEKRALRIVRRNLRARLMVAPLRNKRILGISPGYRTGCKLVALDEKGAMLANAIVHPHTPLFDTDKAIAKIVEMIQQYDLSLAVIGDGTGCQETEALLADIIADGCPEFRYAVLSEAEAAAYAESPASAREFPDLADGLKTAVSLARRALDPLRELTKINIRSLCPKEYMDDVDGAELKKLVHEVAVDCVAEVGADANGAPGSLLRWVPGLGGGAAADLAKLREEQGRFESREAIKQVPKLTEDLWRQAVGFLRVEPAANPLDATRIHPDHYAVATGVLEQLEVTLDELPQKESRDKIRQGRNSVNYADLEKKFGSHYLLIKDILDELGTPWPDPRREGTGPVLRSRVLSFDDLAAGQALLGTVRKVVDFGAFVDVGLSEDGLVHISELSDRFVESPYDVVSEGELVRVKVVEVDSEKKRIALTMRSEEATRRPPRRRTPRPEHERARVPADARTARADVPRGTPGHGIRAPQSTVGKDSRRVRKIIERKPDTAPAKPAESTAPQQTDGAPAEPATTEPPRPAKASELMGKLGFAAVEKRGKREQGE